MISKMLSRTVAKTALSAMIACLSVAAQADETRYVTTLAAGATTAPIVVPGAQIPVSVTCSAAVAGDSGVGQVTMMRLLPAAFFYWVGMDLASNMNTNKIVTGQSSTAGTHVIFCDFAGLIDIQIFSATQIQVKNTDNQPAALVLHFLY